MSHPSGAAVANNWPGFFKGINAEDSLRCEIAALRSEIAELRAELRPAPTTILIVGPDAMQAYKELK